MTPTPGKRTPDFVVPTPSPQDVLPVPARWRLKRVLSLLAACALLGFVGCSGGESFTGGGVPIGKATLRGRVVSAGNTQLPLYNALITVIATPSQGNPQTLQTNTDHNGMFLISNIPTDPVTGRVSVIATGPDNSSYESQQFNFLLTNNHASNIIFALPPSNYHYQPGTTVFIDPPQSQIQPGQQTQFTAHLRDPNGSLLPLTPTLYFDDDFGVLNSDGTFTSNGAGTGDIVAYWYDGLKASASVIVNSAQAQLPPNPPQ